MARFIEVTPIKYGEEQPRMLISTEKIDYVREDDEGFSVIYLKDVPLMPFTKNRYLTAIFMQLFRLFSYQTK